MPTEQKESPKLQEALAILESTGLTVDDLPTDRLHQLHGGLRGPADRDEVIDDQDPVALLDGVPVHLEVVLTVLQLVGPPHGVGRQLPWLAGEGR